MVDKVPRRDAFVLIGIVDLSPHLTHFVPKNGVACQLLADRLGVLLSRLNAKFRLVATLKTQACQGAGDRQEGARPLDPGCYQVRASISNFCASQYHGSFSV